MSVASADEAMNTSDVPDPPTTGLQLQQQPIEKIHHPENSHSFDEGECARAVGQGGHEEGGFAGIITGNSAVSSLNATAASTNVATIAVDSTAGAQKNGNGQLTPENESANVVASSGELAVSPSQPPPPPPSYALALGMSRSPRGYGTSTITKAGPSADKADVVHVSPSQPPHHVPSASSRGATKTTTTISPIGAGAANSAGAGGSGAPGASENVLLGSPPPPPYEVILSPVADKASMVEHVEVLGGDSAALSMTPAGLDHITASVPPTVSAALHPTDPVEGEFSRMFFGAFKSLGVPTTGVATRDWGGEKEKTEVKEKEKVREKKKDIGGAAVSRLRQIFERNNFDSKKRASLEARPLSRPIAAVTAPSIGEHEVTEKIVAAVPQASVDAAGASAALDTDASVPAVGPIAVGTSPVVAFDNTVGTGLAPTSGPPKQAPSSAAEQSDGAMAAVRAVAQDHPSVLAQSALLSVADTRSTSGTSRPLILPERMGESSSAQTASFAEASGVPIISSPADILVGEEQAPCEEEHVPTEGEVSMPTEEAASTKVAVKKTSTFRFSLQEMFFESSKDAASPKASGLAGGGPAPAVYQRENESPGTGTGLTGSTRGQDADEVRLTTASIADDNFAAAVDEAQMVGVVSPPGVMTNPSMLYAFSAPTTGIEQASIATVEGEIHEDAASVESETDVPMTEGRSGDWVHVVESPVSTTVTGEATMPELVQELADTGSNAAVSAPVDVGVVEIADAVDGGTTEEDNEDGTEVKMAGGMPVATTEASVPDVVSRAMEAVTDELSPTAAPVSSEIVEDSSLPLYMGSNTFLHGLSSSTSVADQMSGSDQVEVPGAPAAEVEQAAGDEESVTLDIHAAAGLVIPEEKTETEQRVAAGEALVAEEGAVVSAAATDDEFDGGKAVPVSMQSADVDGEQTAEELGRDEMALAKVDSASPAGTGTAIPSDSAGEMEPVATQLSSLVADKVPEVQAAAWNVEDSANAMTAGTTDSFIKQPVPVTEAVVEGDGMLPSAVEGNDDEVEDELNVVDAFSSGGVEELREMFDQKVSRADTADGDMAGIALDTTIFQTKEGEVVHQTVSASEELATALTAVGDTPGAAMPPTPADGAGEDGQTCALEGAEDAPDSGDFAVFDAVLDLTAVENQPAEPEEAHVGPIAKVYDVIGEVAASVAASVKPETVPLAEAGKEDDAQLSRTWETMQVAVQECAPEVSQGFLATGPDGAPPSYLDVVGANTVGHTIDGGTPEKDREDGKEVGIAGGGPVTATVAVPGPVCDAIETTPDQRAPITAPSPGAGIEGSTPLLSLGSITLVPDLSSSASMADHMSDGNPGEISGEAAPDVDQAARNDLSVTPDNVLAEVDPVMLGADVEPEQRVSTRDGLVAEEGAVVSAAAADDDSAADKAIPVSPESAGVEIELGTALEVVGTVSLIADEGAGVTEGAGGAEPVTIQHSPSAVDQVPEVEAAGSVVEDPSVNAATDDLPIEQLIQSVVADDPVDDTGTEAGVDEPVPLIEASAEGDVVLTAVVEKIDDVVDEEPNVAGADPPSRVEELRQTFDQKTSRADEETLDGDVADVAEGNGGLQAEEGKGGVGPDAAVAVKELPAFPAAGGGNPVVAMLFPTAEDPREEDQSDVVVEDERASGGGDAAFAAAVLDKADPSVVADQLSGTATPHQAPVATVEDVDPTSVRPEYVPMTDVGVKVGTQRGEPSCAVPVPVQDTAVEVSQVVETARPGEALMAPVDGRTMKRKKGDGEVDMDSAPESAVATVAVIPDAVTDAIEAVIDEPSLVDTPMSGVGVEGGTSSLSTDVVSAGDEGSAILDGAHADAAPVALGAEAALEQPVSASMDSMEVDGTDAPVAATDGVSGASEASPVFTESTSGEVEQTVEEAVSDDTATTEDDIKSPAGADTAGPSEGAGSVEHLAPPLSSLVVDQVPEVEAAVMEVEDSSANEATDDLPIEQLIERAVPDDPVDDTGPEAGGDEHVPLTEALVEGVVVLVAVEEIEDVVNEGPNVAGADPPSRVEELRQMLDQKASRADEETPDGEVADVADNNAGLQAEEGNVRVGQEAAFAAEELSDTPAAGGANPVVAMPLRTIEGSREDDQVDAVEEGGSASVCGGTAVAAAVLEKVEPSAVAEQLLDDDGAGAPVAAKNGVSSASDASPAFTDPASGKVEQTAEEVVSDDAAPAEEDIASPVGIDAAGPSEGAGSAEPLTSRLSSLVEDQVPEVEAAVMEVEDSSANESTEDSPIEQPIQSAVADDAVDDTGPEAGADEPVPLTEASVGGDVVLAAAMKKIDDKVDEEPNVAGADPPSRVEELRQMLDQKASRADEETPDGEVADVPEDDGELQVGEGNVCSEAAFAAEELSDTHATGGVNPVVAIPVPTNEGSRENEQSNAVEEGGSAFGGGNAAVAAAVLDKVEPSAVAEQLLDDDGACAPVAATDGVSSASDPSPASTDPTCGKVEQAVEEVVSHAAAPAEQDVASPAGTDAAGPSEGAGSVEHLATPLSSLVVDRVPEVEAAVMEVEDSSANECTEDSPIEQLIESVVADDPVDDTGPEAGADEPVPLTEAPVEGDVVVAAAVEKIDDEVDEGPNVAGADPPSRVEELRQMLDQKASRADEETPDGEVADVPVEIGGLQAEKGSVGVDQEAAFAAEELSDTHATGGVNPVVAIPVPTTEGSRENEQSNAVAEGGSAFGGGDAAVAAAVLDKVEPSAVAEQLLDDDGACAPVAATDGVSSASDPSPASTDPTCGKVEQAAEEVVSHVAAPAEEDVASPAGTDAARPSEGAGSVEHLAPPLSSLVVDQVPEVEAAVMEVEDSSANECTEDSPIEQPVKSAVADDAVDESVPLTEASVEGDVVVAAAVGKIYVVVDEEPNVSGAAVPSRVEELRQMLDQKASRADEETSDDEVSDVAENNAGLQVGEGNVCPEAAFAAEELPATPAAGEDNPVVVMPLHTTEGPRENEQSNAVEDEERAFVGGDAAVAAAVLEKVEPSAVAEQLLEDDVACLPAAATDGVSIARTANPEFTDPASGEVEQTAEETVSDDAAPAEQDIASPAGIDAAGPSEGAGSVEPLATPLSSLVMDRVPEVEAAVMEVEDSSANEATENSPIEQPIQSAVADDAVDDTGPEAGADEPVPLTEASVGGDVVLAAAVKKIDDEVDEEPNVAGADPPSRVEELRQMLDQKASRADEETPDGEVADVPEENSELQVGEGNVCSEAAFAAEELPDAHATGGVNPVVAIPVPTTEGTREQSNAVEEGGSAFGGGDAAVAAAVLDKVEPSAVAEQLLDDDGACAPVAATDGVSSASDPSPASTDPTCGKVEQAAEEVVSHVAAPAEEDVASPAGTDAARPSEGAGSVEHLAPPLSSLVVDQVPEVEAAVMEVEDSSANECTEDSPIEQLIESVVPDDPVDDTGPEAGADEPVPLTEAPVEGDVVVAAAMEKIDDEVDEGPNVAGADPPSRVEELRQMLDQKASRADEETPDGEVADVPVEIGGLQAEKGNVRVGQEAAFAAEELPTLPPAGGANPVVAMPPPTTEGSRENEQSNAVEEGGSAFGGGDAAVAAAVLDKVEPSAVAEQLLEEDRAGAPVAATDGVSSASDPSPAFTDPTCGKVEQAAEEVVSHVAAPTEQHVASPAGTDTARPSEGAGSVEHLAPPLSSLVVDQVPEVEAAVMEVEDSSANECTEDSPIEQPVKSAVADDAVDESVPRTKASVEGDVVVAAAVKIYVVVDEEPNVAGAAVSSRVEELRQVLDQKASRADEETSDGEVSDVAENNAGLQAEEGNVVEEAAFAAEELPTLPAAGEDNPVVAVPLHTTEGSREDEQVDAVEEADSASVSGNAAVAAAVLDKAEPSAVAEQLLDDDGTGAPAAATDGVSSVRNANPGFTDPASGEVEQAVEEVVSDDAAPTEQYVASPASTDAAGPSEGAGSAERLATPLSSLVVDQVPEVEGAVEVEDSSANEATDDSPIEQLIESVVPDDAVDDTGPEAGADEPVPLTEASVERDVILAAVVKKIDDVVDEEPNVAGADPPSRVEELRQMLDQKASHADEEAAYGEVSDVAENNARLQAEEGNVVEEAAFSAEELPTLPAAGGVNPVVAVPLHTTEGQREDEQVDAVEEADSASVSGNAAVAAAVLENAEPSAIAHQLSGTPMPYQAPVATVGELMEVDPTSVRPEGISMTDARAEEATQTAESLCAVPELTKDSAAEVLQDLATERPGGSPPAPVCWRTTEQKLAEGGVNMAGATKSALATSVAVVPGAVTDAIEAVIDQPALVHTLVPGVDVKDCTLSLPAGFASAGDEVTATLDGAQAEAEPVALGAEAALEQPVSAGMGCMEEDGAGALAAATDEVSGANNTSPVFTESMTGEVEQTAEEVESNVAAPAEEDVASLAGTEATGPSEGAGSVGPLAPPLSSLVVDQSTEDSPIEQLVESAVADDAVDDTGPEAGADEPVPLTEASVEGDVVLAAAMEKIDDVVDEEPNVAGADPSRRVEELRQMFDQKASRADEETAYGDVADVPEDKSGLQVKEGNVGVGQEAAFAAEELPTLPAAGGANPMVAMPLPTTEGQRENEQVDAVEEEERASAGGDATVAAAVLVKAESSAVTEQLLEEDGACLPAAATNGVSSANNASPLFTYPTCGKVKQTAEETVSDDAAPTKGDMASPSGTDTAVLSQGAGGVEPRATPLLSLVVDQVPDEGAVTAVESSPPNEATDLPIEQLIQSVVADDLLDDTGPEAGADEPVPLTEASVEGDVVLAAAMEEIDDEVDEEPNVAGADPSRRVEELRQMFDQKASRADEEIPYGDVADVPEDNGELQAEERNVVKVSAFAAEELPTLPAAGGDNPMVAMPLPTAEALAEDKQSDAVEEEESTSGGGDAVVAAVVMDKAEPSAVTDQLSGTATPYQAPVAMMEDAIEVDPTSVRPGGVSLTDARAEEGTHGTATSCSVPVPVQDGAAEVSQDVTTVRPGGSPLAPVDGRTTEQNTAGGQVKMAGAPESAVSTVAVGPNAVSDAIEAMIDELALVDKPISGVGVEGSTSSLSAGVTSAGDEVSAASDGAHDGESGASEAMPMLTESAGADADQTAEVSDETVPVKVYRASSADDRTTCSSEGTPEVSQEIEGLDQALGGDGTEQHDKEVDVAGGGGVAATVAAVHEPVSDTIEHMSDQLPPTSKPVSGAGTGSHNSLLSVVPAIPVPGFSSSPSMADQMSDREQVEAAGAATAASAVEHASEDEPSDTLDEVDAEVKPVSLGGETEPDQPVSTSEALGEEDDAVASAAAVDGASGACEVTVVSTGLTGVETGQTVGALASDDAAPAEAPIAAVEDTIEDGFLSIRPEAVSVSEVCSDEGAQTADPSVAVPVPVQETTRDEPPELAFTGSGGEPTTPADAADTNTFDGAVDGERAELGKDDEEDVKMAGTGLVDAVPDVVSSAIEAGTDQLAPPAAPGLGEGGDDSTSTVLVDSSTLVHGMSADATVVDQMSDGEPDKVEGVTAAAEIEQAAGDEMPVTLESLPAEVVIVRETGSEQPISASEALVEDSAVAPAVAADGESGAPARIAQAGGEAAQTVGERVSGFTTASRVPIATAGDVIEDDAEPATRGTSFAIDIRSEDWIEVVGPSITVPAPEQSTAPEAPQALAAISPHGELSLPVDVVADNFDGVVDADRAEQDKEDGEGVEMASEGSVNAVSDAVPDAIEAVTGRLAPTPALSSSEGVQDNTLPLSDGPSTLAHGMSSDATVIDQISHGEPVETARVAAVGNQTAGDGLSVTADNVHAEIKPVTPDEDTEPERRVSASGALVEEESAVIPAAAPGADGESSEGAVVPISTYSAGAEANRMLEEPIGGITALAEAFITSPKGAKTAGLKSGEILLSTVAVNEPPQVELGAVILGDAEVIADTAGSPIDQLGESAVGDAPVNSDQGTVLEQPLQAAEAVGEGGMVDATEDVNAADRIPTCPESAGAKAEESKLAVVNEIVSGGTAPVVADALPAGDNSDNDGSVESAEIVELRDDQPVTGDARTNAGQEAEVLVGSGVLVSPAAPGAEEESCVGDAALTPTESAGVQVEQEEAETAVELVSGGTAPVMLDAEALAPVPGDSRTPAIGGLVSSDLAGEGTPLQGNGQSFEGKKRHNPFGFLPKLLGWDKKDNRRSRVARGESATQAALGHGTAARPLVSTAAGDFEDKEATTQGGKSAVDGQASSSADSAVMTSEPLEEIMVPAPTAGGIVSDRMENKRLSHEAGNRYDVGGLATTAPAPQGLEEPTSTKKNQDGGFSLPKLFGWVKQDTMSSRAVSFEAATPQVTGEISPEETENPIVDDEFSIVPAMMSAGGVSDPIEDVSDSIHNAADERLRDDEGDTELATTQEPVFAEVERTTAASLEAPVLSPDTISDVYKLKVQVGAEHAFPVVASDVPVAEVSPLAHHFAEFDQEERIPSTAGASTLAVADEVPARMDEEAETDATSEPLSMLSPVAAAPKVIRPGETFKLSATGNSNLDNVAAVADLPPLGVAEELAARMQKEGQTDATIERLSVVSPVAAGTKAMRPEENFKPSATGNSTLNNDPAEADLPPSGVEETAASARVNVCGITKTGMADSTATFGVVDFSALMAEETAEKACPNLEPQAPTVVRGPQRSLSPGWKGYVDADASPETAGVAGGVDQAGVSLQSSPGDAEGRAEAGDPYASSAPGTPTLNVCSPHENECAIS
eukprot:g18499.t1